MESPMRYILASASPRRKEILSAIGLEFEVVVSDTDEKSDVTDPVLLTKELASQKGIAVAKMLFEHGEELSDTVIISADTVVACDGEILGKPRDEEDAGRMLRMLSGREHAVVSGMALTYRGVTYTDASVTKVFFDELDEAFIESYIQSGSPMDKAGAYGIQEKASVIVNRIDGPYFNVVGLDPNCLFRLAKKNGIPFGNF